MRLERWNEEGDDCKLKSLLPFGYKIECYLNIRVVQVAKSGEALGYSLEGLDLNPGSRGMEKFLHPFMSRLVLGHHDRTAPSH